MTKLQDIFDVVEEIAPPVLAEEWDSIGLQIGNANDEARGIMVALDPSLMAVKTASQQGCNLLLTHHPLFFGDINRIDLATTFGNIIRVAVDQNITIFSAHTNLDSASGGLNDILADTLQMLNTLPLKPLKGRTSTKEGLGRIGRIKEAMKLSEIAQTVKKKLGTDSLRLVGNPDAKVRTIAICTGSGGDLVEIAFQSGADLYMTGDIKYHHARKAEELGIALIDFGHFSSEKSTMISFSNKIEKKLTARNIQIPVKEFFGESEPFKMI